MSKTEIKPRGCNKTANMCFLATALLQRIAQNQVTQELGRRTRHSAELERRRFLACLLVVGGGGWPPVPLAFSPYPSPLWSVPSSTCLLLPSPLGVRVGGTQCPVMPSTREGAGPGLCGLGIVTHPLWALVSPSSGKPPCAWLA